MAQELDRRTAAAGAPSDRMEWLDGVRALAAFFVVLHHAWFMTVGGYPENNGPWFTDWLIYGHLAVSVFIVVSGFSLTLSPAKHGMSLKDGGWGFLRRRFWRIVPPFWAALILVTVLIGSGLTDPANGPDFGLHDFVVHFLLLQDAIGNVSPNGAFWSIAVEWHIYFLFPLILVCFRCYGIKVVMPGIAALVVAQHLIGAVSPPVAALDRFTPAYLVLFAAGAAAAWLVRLGQGVRPANLLAGTLGASVLTYMLFAGSVRTTTAYFWIDLLVGSSVAALFVALGQGRLQWMTRALSAAPLAFIGSFAFSLYLIHAPVLAMLTTYLVRPAGLGELESLALLLLFGCPASVGAAYLFFLVFERPFLTIRSFRQLLDAIGSPFARRGRHSSGMPAQGCVTASDLPVPLKATES